MWLNAAESEDESDVERDAIISSKDKLGVYFRAPMKITKNSTATTIRRCKVGTGLVDLGPSSMLLKLGSDDLIDVGVSG